MTLNAFNWATNVNYSAGPDTGTPTKVNPASTGNGFVAATIAAPQHVNYLYNLIASELLKAVDGSGGGTYVLAAPLEFQGADVRIAGDLEILSGGELNVQAGGFVTILGDVALGADLTTAGAGSIIIGSNTSLNVQNLAVLNLNAGSVQHVFSTASIDVSSGGAIRVASGGTVQLDRARDLTIDGEAFAIDLMLTPVGFGYDTGVPIWLYDNDTTLTKFAWLQKLTTIGARNWIAFAVPGRPGDTIDHFTVRIEGGFGAGHGALLPTNKPIARLVRIDQDGAVTVIASANDPSLSAAAYDAPHDVPSATGIGYTFAGSASERVYLQVLGESDTNSVPNTTALHHAFVVGTRNSFLGNVDLEYV